MKKIQFQRALAERLMKAVMEEVCKDTSYPSVSFTTKTRTIRITLRDGMNRVNIYLPTTGMVDYSLKDYFGDGERENYYRYHPDDDHEKVIEKTVADMTMLVAAFLKVGEVHDFTDMDLFYENDNKPVIDHYLECYDYKYRVDDGDEDEDE